MGGLLFLRFLRVARQANNKFFFGPVVLVNCQLAGGAHEGQPGFTLVFAKAVLLNHALHSAVLVRCGVVLSEWENACSDPSPLARDVAPLDKWNRSR